MKDNDNRLRSGNSPEETRPQRFHELDEDNIYASWIEKRCHTNARGPRSGG